MCGLLITCLRERILAFPFTPEWVPCTLVQGMALNDCSLGNISCKHHREYCPRCDRKRFENGCRDLLVITPEKRHVKIPRFRIGFSSDFGKRLLGLLLHYWPKKETITVYWDDSCGLFPSQI